MARRANGEGTLYRLPDGRWRVSITVKVDGQSRRISRVRQKRSDAVAVLAELRAQVPSMSARPAAMTITDVTGKWMALHVERKTGRSTQDTYRRTVKNHIAPRIGDVLLRKLTALKVEEWVAEMERDKVKSRARQYAFQTLRTALNFAIHPMGVLQFNPCDKLATPEHESRKIHPFEETEVRAIMQESAESRWEAFYSIAFGCGLRWGEMAALTWQQLDMESGLVHIDRQLLDVAGICTVEKPKTKSSIRTVAVPTSTRDALRRHKAILMKAGHAAGELVFPNTVGRHLCRANFHDEVWSTMLGLLGLAQRGVHHCRHTFATMSLSSGVSVADVAKALGHSSPAMTYKVYAHALKSNSRATADAMDRLIG